jgi:hypothetical protein
MMRVNRVNPREEIVEGYLEVGNDGHDVIVNHPKIKVDASGVGHIVFSPTQARNFAAILLRHADAIETEDEY